MYLDRVEFVDSWSEVVWISSERDLELCQKLVHASQQCLWPVSHTHKQHVYEAQNANEHRVNSLKHSLVCLCASSYVLAQVFLEGTPSNTMTRSARYVAMMKSCSTTKAVFFACKMNL